ncbi:hypothetical protein F4818DRAFT_395064 [Hypoxylon cercidicola]|nr:hypothetical protein F4818DRAFT_395064 [Hypoxylon cercidicola]
MIRLPPTTLSLTMTEVKEFERHFRFKKYLAKEDALGRLPFRPKSRVAAVRKSYESALGDANQPTSEAVSKESSPAYIQESPRLLACPPRRLPKSGADSVGSNSQGMPSSSRSGTSSSSNVHPPGWGNLPIPLPPPFSKDKRSVSDAQSLPSSQHGIQARPGDSPATPPRRSSLRGVHVDIRSSPPPRRDRRRLVSSAVRFVESFVRSPSRGSPSSPSPRIASSDSASPMREDELRPAGRTGLEFRVYDDSLPASSQPQTPHNLPEARHQSRLRGSYTAPLPRAGSRSAYHHASREGTRSPFDLETSGFRGLHRGRENTEDSALFYEASRFREGGSPEDE